MCELETPRFLLSPLKEEDLEDMYLSYARYEEVTRYLTWAPYSAKEEGRDFLLSQIEREKKGEYVMGIREKESGRLIGSIDVVAYYPHGVQIGYVLSPSYWRKGVMREAFSRSLFYLFFEKGYDYCLMRADEENTASNALITSFGFHFAKKILVKNYRYGFRMGNLYYLSKKEYFSSYLGKYRIKYSDEEYPLRKEGWEAKPRVIARAIVEREDEKIALHEVVRDDIFGKDKYVETPGGGIKCGERLEEALIRECEEELGMLVSPQIYLGSVEDEYRLIGRKNITHYFYAKVLKKNAVPQKVSRGDSLIANTLWLTKKEAYEKMKENANARVPFLVKRRELPFLELFKEDN